MQYFKLNNNRKIPAIGSGTNTFGKVNHEYMAEINFDTTEIESAIRAGYRHFDTAISYRNESVLAKGIEASGINRTEFFITSKIPGKPEYYANTESVKKGIQESLDNLKTDYIDLYLIHHPWEDPEGILSMWQILEDYADQGILKSIGVSNFEQDQLEHLLNNSRIKPTVNQVESHPGNWNDALINYCHDNNIVPEAWSPLSGMTKEALSVLDEIGSIYGKSPAQIILRYQLDRGVVVIPKSHNGEHQASNLDLFDFTLTKEDRQKIAQI